MCAFQRTLRDRTVRPRSFSQPLHHLRPVFAADFREGLLDALWSQIWEVDRRRHRTDFGKRHAKPNFDTSRLAVVHLSFKSRHHCFFHHDSWHSKLHDEIDAVALVGPAGQSASIHVFSMELQASILARLTTCAIDTASQLE